MKCVIIGMGPAGITCAETLLQEDASIEVTIIASDKAPYSRCMLHYYLDGERSFDNLNFAPKGFFTDNNRLTVMPSKNVSEVDSVLKNVIFDDGTKVGYDKLLIATGAKPFVPPIEGLHDAKNRCVFRDIDDVDKIIENAKPNSKCVIVGAGVAALDAAYGLLEKGVDVSLIEMFPRISPLQLDDKAAHTYQKLFEEHGAKFYLGRRVISVDLDENRNATAVNTVFASAVSFDNNEKIPCDFLIIVAGVRPNFSFLKDSGIQTDKSILVKRNMQTSDLDVYAAGDCAGQSGIWPNAKNQGVVAAKNMLGGKEEYTDVYAMKNTMNFYGLTTLTIGNVNIDDTNCQSDVYESRNLYYRYVIKDNKIVAVLLQGSIARMGIWLHIIKNNIDVSKIKKPLHKIRYSDFYKVDEKGAFEYAI